MEQITAGMAAAFCGGILTGDPQAALDHLIIDSREARPGALFTAIKGERADGHRYIAGFFAAGGTACLSQEAPEVCCPQGIPEGKALILVEDSVKAMGLIMKEYLHRYPAKVVGITGSVGKTSCKDMVAAALSGGLNTVKTQGNFNNQYGLPLTIQQVERDTQVLVAEMGMNHFGEIDYLASLAEPDMGIITNIGIAHIELLGSREGILKAKSEIIPHLKKGPLFVNGDDDMLITLKEGQPVPVETFGFGEDNDCCILSAEDTEDARERVVLRYRGEVYDFVLNTMGRHMVMNAAPAVMAAVNLGLSREQMLAGLASYVPSAHRLARIETKRYLIIDDSYNSNPISAKAALDTLAGIPGDRRKVAILGDMLELGEHSRDYHREVGAYAATVMSSRGTGWNVLMAAGEESRALWEGAKETGKIDCYWFPDKEALIKKGLSILAENDIILLKASHGKVFSDITKYLTD